MKKITLTQLVFGTAFLLTMLTPIVGSAQIIVEEFITDVQPFPITAPDPANPGQGFQFNLGSIDIDEDELLVVAVAFEGPSSFSAIQFLGQEIDPILTEAAANASGIQTAIFVSDEVSGSIDLTFATDAAVSFPGFYAASLSGAGEVETAGAFTDMEGDSSASFNLTGVGEGSFVLGAYADQLGLAPDVTVSGDLTEVQNFNGAGNEIGSAVGAVATGFGTGSSLGVTFSDASAFIERFQDPILNNRSSFSFVSIAPAPPAVPEPGSVIVLALAGLAATTRRRR